MATLSFVWWKEDSCSSVVILRFRWVTEVLAILPSCFCRLISLIKAHKIVWE